MKPLFTLLQLLLPSLLFCQLKTPEFGIMRYGNTVQEPFHTAIKIHQDEYGKLVAYQNLPRDRKIVFDGERFHIPKTPKYKAPVLLEDANGSWHIDGSFTLVLNSKKVSSLDVRKYVDRNICELRAYEDIYYLSTNDGLIKLKVLGDSISFVSAHKYGTDRIENFHKSNDTVYFHTGKSLHYSVEPSLDEFNTYTIDGLEHSSVFMLPGRRLPRQNLGSHYNTIIALNKSLVAYMVDSKDRLWTYQRDADRIGVYLYRSDESAGEKLELGLEEGTYCSFYEDNLGDIWVGTRGEGILQLYEKSIITLDKAFGTKSNNIWSVHQDKEGKVYISEGCSGYEVFDNDSPVERYDGCQAAILRDSKGRTWVSTVGVILKEQGKPDIRLGKRDGLYSRSPFCIFEDSGQDIWIATRRALHKYVDGRFEVFVIEETETYDKLFNIVELANGKLLIAVSNGSFYTFKKGKFTKVQDGIPDPMHMIKDQQGQVWLATESDGIYVHRAGKFEKLMGQNIPKRITFLQHSDNGLLWGLCPDNTIFYASKLDLLGPDMEYPVNILTHDDGLPLINSNSRLQPSTCKLQNGNIIFPNIHGAIMIDPQRITKQKKGYNFIYGQANSDLLNPKHIQLELGVRELELMAKGVYLNPEKTIQTVYSFDNENWIAIPYKGSVLLKNLSGGEQVIYLKSRHVNGNWLHHEKFTITTPLFLYEKWWFMLAMILLMSSMIFLLVRWRTTIVRIQNKRLASKIREQTKQLEAEKIQLSASLTSQLDLTHKLNLSQDAKNRMYAQISHEFRSPLQAISIYLDKSERYIGEQEKLNIGKNIKNLLNISNEILALSKAEAGEMKLKSDYYNINSIIAEQVELKLPLAEAKQIKFIASLDKVLYLLVDLSLIQKVISNLLSNAIKFSPKGSSIVIHSETIEDGHYVAVEDAGLGIPSDELESLTADYYQATNNSEQGTGIGLSLAERILHLHSSKLSISSTLGHGSTFSFKLPLPTIAQHKLLSKLANSENIEEQLKRFIDPSKAIILAVDDNVDVLHFIKKVLTVQYYVVICTNAKIALEELTKIKPALLISDVNMPIMSGFDFIKAVRSQPQFKALPFLFLTGSLSEETEILSLKFGADHILQKPINHDYLLSQVSRMLARQSVLLDAGKMAVSEQLLPKDIKNDDLLLIQEIEAVMLAEISNTKLKSEDIAASVNMGEKTLRNRVKKISGYTVKEYLKNYRLERAKSLLAEGYGNKSEVAAAVGFSSLSYFSQSLKSYDAENSGRDV